MNSDMPNEDRALAEALARSIEAQTPRQTPFARSRIAARLERPPRRFPFAPMLGAAAALLLALAIGSWLVELRADRERSAGIAPSANPSAAVAAPSPSGAATPPVAAPSPSATATPAAPLRVFFPREGLPPVSAIVAGTGPQASPEDRIRSRLDALNPARSPAVPLGAFNPFPLSDPAQLHVASVVVGGDTASVDFALPDGGWRWSAGNAPQVRGLLQELVYSATEEPGIRRVTMTENGGKPTSIGGVAVAPALSREDVFGYAQPGDTRPFSDAVGTMPATLSTTYSVDQFAPGLLRFVIRVESAATPGSFPYFTVNLVPNDDAARPGYGKYTLSVEVPGGRDPTTAPATVIDRSPLRAIVAAQGQGSLTYSLALDDQRPWRATVLFDPVRLVIDIGGAPSAISDDGNTVVYAPVSGGSVGTAFNIGGVVRAFEAGYVWRVRDASGTAIASGNGTASIAGMVWGAYDAKVTLPPGTVGRVTLEVFQRSARDGSEVSKVTIPLTVR
ncbi:MAG: Gmad2 immunoglobulin-like domain-containing protein [Candidatus Limnocylindria bacterium]